MGLGKAAKRARNLAKKKRDAARRRFIALLDKVSEMEDEKTYSLQDEKGNFLPFGEEKFFKGIEWKQYFGQLNNK